MGAREPNMKTIKVGISHISFVDDEDYELVSKYEWRCEQYDSKRNPYARYKDVYMHDLVLGRDKGSRDSQCHHINHNSLDNRRENLKVVTAAENSRLRTYKNRSKSGRPGVTWIAREGNWRASIKVDGTSIQIGSYKDFEKACKAREEAELLYWGYTCR